MISTSRFIQARELLGRSMALLTLVLVVLLVLLSFVLHFQASDNVLSTTMPVAVASGPIAYNHPYGDDFTRAAHTNGDDFTGHKPIIGKGGASTNGDDFTKP